MNTKTIGIAGTLCFLASAAVFGQRVTGSIDGRVSDTSGALLPGVAIMVTHEATGQARSMLTNEMGLYNIPLLPSGAYQIEAAYPGFRVEVRRGILVEVDRNARVDIQLEIGDITERIEVLADAPLVQVDTSALGQVIDSTRVAQLPLNGRDFLQLASLTPGVQPAAEGSNLSTQSGSVNVNGAREVFNNFMLDGIDNNDSGPAQLVIVPSIDSIQEFKVQTSNYSAEYGRSAGGLINVSTKSGSNAFHGSAYEFLRNSALDARNFFDNPNQPKPAFKRNQFGATFGGPIAVNKTFFFGAYERTVIRQPLTATSRVPSVEWRNGDFSSLGTPVVDPITGVQFPRNIIPRDRINAIGSAMLDLYPLPNTTGVNNLSSVSKLTVNQDSITGRVDHQFGSNDTAFIRYSYWNQPRMEPYARNNTTIGGYGVFLETRTQSLAISHTHVFGPNLVNEVRLGYARLKGGLFAESRTRPDVRTLALPGTRVFEQPDLRPDFLDAPQVVLVGFTAIPTGSPQIRYDNMYDYIDGLSYSLGAHKLKAGFEGRRAHNNFHSASTANGRYQFENRYTGNAVADLLLGYPSQTMRNLGDMDMYARSWYLSGYFQDDWRVNDRLTLNLGVRYEFQSNGYTEDDRKVNFNPETGLLDLVGSGPIPANVAPILAAFPGIAIKSGTLSRSGWLDDYDNFAPRLGFAYDLTGDGRSVIRGGGGLFYVNVASNKSYQNSQAFPFQISNTVFASTDPRNPNLSLSNPFPTELLSTGIVGRSVDMNMRTPYMLQQNLSIQRQLGATTLVEIGYAGSKGNGLHRGRNLNAAPLGPGAIASRRPYPTFSTINQLEGSANSNYHSLQLRMDRRLSKGVSVLGAYTWSKSLDDDSDITGPSGGASQNPYNLHDDRGPSVFDRTHRLSAAFLWALPFGGDATGFAGALVKGWNVNGIYAFSSGQPFTPSLSADNSLTGTGADRPDSVGNWQLASPDPSRWFNTAAFTIPVRGTFGNAGRNQMRGPGTNNMDLSMFKSFPYEDNPELVQFRAEIFNIANHPQFYLPNRFVDSPQFGTISRARDSRQVQVSLRLRF